METAVDERTNTAQKHSKKNQNNQSPNTKLIYVLNLYAGVERWIFCNPSSAPYEPFGLFYKGICYV